MSLFSAGANYGDRQVGRRATQDGLGARKTQRRRNRLHRGELESIADQVVAFERLFASQTFAGERPALEELKDRAELVLAIEERALEIDDEARERRASLRLRIAAGWLPITLMMVAALLLAQRS